jgi:hypothetical protein
MKTLHSSAMIIKENELIEEFRDLSLTGEFIPSEVRINMFDHQWFIIERRKKSDWTVELPSRTSLYFY